eukprot:13124529-Alexandrium_andersonii.AAC.1
MCQVVCAPVKPHANAFLRQPHPRTCILGLNLRHRGGAGQTRKGRAARNEPQGVGLRRSFPGSQAVPDR